MNRHLDFRAALRLGVAVGFVLLLATGCGSGGDPDESSGADLSLDEKTVAANIADSFTSQSGGALTRTESTCFADRFVETIGLDKLKEARLITDDGELNEAGAAFTGEISTVFADSFLECVDYPQKQAEQLAAGDDTVDLGRLETCLRKAMPEEFVRKLIVASQTDDPTGVDLVEQSTQKLTTCKQEATTKSGKKKK